MIRGYCLCFSLISALCLTNAGHAQGLDGRAEALLEEQLSAPGRLVDITGFEGAVSTRASFARLTMADAEGVWLILEDAVLDWTASALLRGALRIEELSAARLIVRRPPLPAEDALPSSETSGFQIPELPVAIDIGRAALTRIELGEPVLGVGVTASFEGTARLDGDGLDLTIRAERLDGPGGTAEIALNFSPETEFLTVKADIREPEGGVAARTLSLPGRPSVELLINGSGPLTDFQSELRLATDGADRLTGTVTIAGNDSAAGRRFATDIRGDIRPLLAETNRPFFGPNTGFLASGLAEADGGFVLQDVQIETAQLSLAGTAEIGADRTPERLRLDGDVRGDLPGAAVSVERASLALNYEAAVSPDWSFRLAAKKVAFDGGSLEDAILDGRGIVEAGGQTPFTGQISLNGNGLSLDDAGLQQAAGTFFEAQTALQITDAALLTLSDLTAQTQNATLVGTARLTPQDGRAVVELDATVEAPDLGAFGPLVSPLVAGSAVARIDTETDLPGGRFLITLDANTTGLDIGQPQLEALLEPNSELKVIAARDENGTKVDTFALSNDLLTVRGQASVSSEDGQASFTAALRRADVLLPELPSGDVTLTGRVTDLVTMPNATLTLEHDAGLEASIAATLDADTLRFDTTVSVASVAPFSKLTAPLRRGQLDAQVSGQADIRQQSVSLQLSGRSNALDLGIPQIQSLISPPTTLSGAVTRSSGGEITVSNLVLRNTQIDARGTARALGAEPVSAQIQAVLADLGRIVPEVPGRLTLDAQLDGDQVAADFNSASGLQGQVGGRVGLPNGAVALRAQGIAPLGLAAPFIGQRTATGGASFDLAVNGVPDVNAVSGQISSRDLRFADPAVGIALSRGQLDVSLADGRAQIGLRGALNDAPLEVRGGLGLVPPFDTALTIALRNFDYAYENIARLRLGADVTLTGPAQRRLEIGGDVRLRRTEIRVPDGGLGSADILPDVVHKGASQGVRETLKRAGLIGGSTQSDGPGPRIPLNLTIRATEPIFVRGRGLDAEFGGTLQVRGTLDDPVPTGTFALRRGRLSFLGQRLDLTQGEITAAGRLVPRLNIVATARTPDVDAQVRIAGPADAPELILSSQPELPQDEVLARLLFGRDVASLSAFQVARLVSSLATLSSNRPGILGRSRMAFGVDDLDIRTDEATGETELAIGNYISDNIYSEVELGVQGDAQVNLNLDLTDNTRLRGSVNSDGGTGLGVFWERDY